MIQSYLSRYLDFSKCHINKKFETCAHCGWELVASHQTDFTGSTVVQTVVCQGCKKILEISHHLLH